MESADYLNSQLGDLAEGSRRGSTFEPTTRAALAALAALAKSVHAFKWKLALRHRFCEIWRGFIGLT